MKKSNEQKLGDAIREMIEAYRLESRLDEVSLLNSWEKVTGKLIAKYTRNIYIKNRKLYVRIESPSLKNELSYARSRIVDGLNKEVGKKVIDDLILL